MDRKTLLNALRHTSFDRHRCFGCGYEHNCSIHGCAVSLAAAELIEEQAARIAELEPPANDPLTLEELREMDGAWVWVIVQYEHCKCDGFAKIITHSTAAYFEQILNFNDYGKTWMAYRRKLEEGAT